MKKISFFILIVIGAFLVQCNSSNNQETQANTEDSIDIQESKSEVNRSELAVLMRNLYNNTRAYGKKDVEQLKPFSIEQFEAIKKMKTAKPTDANDTGKVFQAYADNFLNSLEMLTHPENVSMVNYNNMVDNCLACHSQHCPGPMPVIRKMKIIKEI